MDWNTHGLTEAAAVKTNAFYVTSDFPLHREGDMKVREQLSHNMITKILPQIFDSLFIQSKNYILNLFNTKKTFLPQILEVSFFQGW